MKIMKDKHSFVDWFRSAAPYIHAHRGRTFVLQIGGDVVAAENFSILLALPVKLRSTPLITP